MSIKQCSLFKSNYFHFVCLSNLLLNSTFKFMQTTFDIFPFFVYINLLHRMTFDASAEEILLFAHLYIPYYL